MKSGNASVVYEHIKGTLKSLGIYEKVKSICSDGASALSSAKNGVFGFLKKDLKGLFYIHCISHRLNLSLTDLWQGDILLKGVNAIIYNLCKHFINSSNRFKILRFHERQSLDFDLKLIRPTDIR